MFFIVFIKFFMLDAYCGAASSFDSRFSCCRESVGSHLDFSLKLTSSKDLNSIFFTNQTILGKNLRIDRVNFLFVNQFLKSIKIYTHIFDAVYILESKLRNSS